MNSQAISHSLTEEQFAVCRHEAREESIYCQQARQSAILHSSPLGSCRQSHPSSIDATASQLKLFLFTTDVSFAKQAEHAGIDSVIVDWERVGKEKRQINYSTEINLHTAQDLVALAKHLTIPITVRINRLGEYSASEIDLALEQGAKIIMLPMAETPSEVEQFLHLVKDRAKTMIQIETPKLVEHCDALRELGWDYAYIGLNDLMIARGSRWIWEPLADGTVEQVFEKLTGRVVGFAGVTVIGGGIPLPFLDLLREMARIGCQLSVLRRTFKREIVGRNLNAEIQLIQAAWEAACCRHLEAIEQDRQNFVSRLEATKLGLESVKPL